MRAAGFGTRPDEQRESEQAQRSAGVVAIITAYYAHELTRLVGGDDVDRLSTSLFDASVDLNPHQIEAALFWRTETMWHDPIVTETRQRREQYAGTLAYDIDAIFEDIRSRQRQTGKRLVSFPARPALTRVRTGTAKERAND